MIITPQNHYRTELHTYFLGYSTIFSLLKKCRCSESYLVSSVITADLQMLLSSTRERHMPNISFNGGLCYDTEQCNFL